MSRFIKLFAAKDTPLTGDIFILKAYNYSEDPDVKNTSADVNPTTDEGKASVDGFTSLGYTTGDPTSTALVGSTNRKPIVYPRQFYLVNDTSGSVNSDFQNELVVGDIITAVDNSSDNKVHHFEVMSTNCVDCDANTVKLQSLDTTTEGGVWVPFDWTVMGKTNSVTHKGATTTDTLNNHETSATEQKPNSTDYVMIDSDTIVAYKQHPTNKDEMIITFKEGIFPKGGYTVIKDITHNGDLNDIVIDASGYMGDEIEVKIEVDSSTSPETFKWRSGEYISSTAPASAYGEIQRGLSLQFVPLNLGEGEIKVKWLATTGHHASTENWTFTVYPNNKKIYRNQVKMLDKIFKD